MCCFYSYQIIHTYSSRSNSHSLHLNVKLAKLGLETDTHLICLLQDALFNRLLNPHFIRHLLVQPKRQYDLSSELSKLSTLYPFAVIAGLLPDSSHLLTDPLLTLQGMLQRQGVQPETTPSTYPPKISPPGVAQASAINCETAIFRSLKGFRHPQALMNSMYPNLAQFLVMLSFPI